MFVGESLRNPDDSYRIEASRIGKELPEVSVIRSFKLVLNQHFCFRRGICAENIRTEWTYFLFLSSKFQFDADCFPKEI